MQKCVGKSLYERNKPSSVNLILNIIIILFLCLFIGELIFNSYYNNIYVKGSSMVPTLTGAATDRGGEVAPGGDYVFVNTRAKPKYFDIVVVKTTDSYGVSYDIIKRVVAFGGDTVRLDRGQLSIKYSGEEEFTPIIEKYVLEEYNTWNNPVNTIADHVVEEGCMFLLGDNRNVSEDSRRRGDYPMSSLVGVVPEWSLRYKSQITAFYTFFEFKLGFNKIGSKKYGN